MSTKKILVAASLAITSLVFAQKSPEAKVDFIKNTKLNLLLRSGYESFSTDASAGSSNGLKVNEARFEVRGKVVEGLEFRVRTRLQTSRPERTLDRANGNLDYAFAAYKFGEKKEWEVVVGKQNNMVGSWEFEKNPTFEYQYSTVGGGTSVNTFPMAVRLGYTLDSNNTFTLQAYNTLNDTFAITTKGYNLRDNVESVIPLGVQLAWQGIFFDKQWRTWYSIGTSEYAKDKRNYQVAIGNKLVLGKFEAYFDVLKSNFAFDHTNITKQAYNAYYRTNVIPGYTGADVIAENINLTSAILRMDYEFVPQWFVTAKGFYETASIRKDNGQADNLRRSTGYLLGLEYQPIAKQNMKFFAYYYGNDVGYGSAVQGLKPVHSSIFGIGALYFINAL